MNELSAVVERFAGRRVLLVGDFMLDRYLYGDAERISPEAPVPVIRVVERQDQVGGAGSVAMNICALGARVRCIGLVGRDAEGALIAGKLREAGAEVSGLLEVADRPTITKTRLVGLAEHRHRQQMLRVDDEIVRPPSASDAERLLAAVHAGMNDAEVVCLEDYAKGLLAPELTAAVIREARRRGIPVYVDPPRTRDWSKFSGCTLLTPNRAELELAIGGSAPDDELAARTAELVRRLECLHVLVTLGRDGALLVDAAGAGRHFPTQPRAVYDNTGAGDAVLAMLAVATAAGASLDDAVRLANIAGGLEVSKFGCVPITRDEVLRELDSRLGAGRGKVRVAAELAAELSARRQRGETVVFTNGCFDILHPGHVELLEQARGLGSLLVVGLNSDASVRSLGKGGDRPIRRQEDRARMLSALQSVDHVVVFDEPDPLRLIEILRPDVLVKGSDWAGKDVVGREVVERRGGRVALVDLVEGYSTTGELKKIRAAGE
ncbi:MAG: D-glycero-beta-D-manno-heptose 1-phosphate adenylyltransferase [Phycisphaerales bacterium]|nr:D-glycero-beta-D-manno-heptose 1-phosphate adenylyltransferase [Phycisphaerales bacterium]